MTGLRLWFNGQPAVLDDLAPLAMLNYGHFTAMQARGGRVQGLQHHFERLQGATQALFASELDVPLLRRHLRKALGESDASVRISVYSRAFDRDRPLRPAAADVLIAIAPPRHMASTSLRVCSVRYQRASPHIKHVGTFDLFEQKRRAQQRGFDDALFVTADDAIAEGSIWNIGFHDAQGIVWPTAPALNGISMQLLKAGLARLGVAQVERRVELAELAEFRGAFFTNTSRAAVPLSGIDAVGYAQDEAGMRLLEAAMATQPWEMP